MPNDKNLSYVSNTALCIIEALTLAYPGLLDGETEVNGADLVDTLTSTLSDCKNLRAHLKELRAKST